MSSFTKGFIVAIAVVAVIAGGVLLFFNWPRQADTVTYEVTGDADAVDIIVQDETGAETKLLEMSLPWTQDYGDFNSDYVYLYAHNNSDSGTVTANIYVNRNLFRTSTVSGAYMTALAVGTK
jgi:hypothetical protein